MFSDNILMIKISQLLDKTMLMKTYNSSLLKNLLANVLFVRVKNLLKKKQSKKKEKTTFKALIKKQKKFKITLRRNHCSKFQQIRRKI